MTKKNIQTLKQLCQVKQKTILQLMTKFLQKSGYSNIIVTKEYLVAIGSIPVGIVAHADTVFNTPPENIYYDNHAGMLWSPSGLGADDRAGIYAIYRIIDNGLRPHVIITTDEEAGCLGAEALIQHYPVFPSDLNFLIELDRRGTKDSVYYDCANRDFETFINSYDFITNYGSFSDISYLAPAWGVAAVNLSVGYFNEHSQIEHLSIFSLERTIKKVSAILTQDNLQFYQYIEKEYPSGAIKCDVCNKTRETTIGIYFETKKGYQLTNICLSCFYKNSDSVEYCKYCNEAWIPQKTPESSINYVCPICQIKGVNHNGHSKAV